MAGTRALSTVPHPAKLSRPLSPASGGDDSSLAARSGGSSGAAAQSSFTRNTALVLEHLRAQLAPAPGSKRRHPSHGDLAAGMSHLSLYGLLESGGAGGGQRGRLDAARWGQAAGWEAGRCHVSSPPGAPTCCSQANTRPLFCGVRMRARPLPGGHTLTVVCAGGFTSRWCCATPAL
jgi:hypothetical protein